MRAKTTILERLQKENDVLRQALIYIRDTIEDIPGGIDYDAREDDLSPRDLAAHIGGLVYNIANDTLLKKG